MRVINLQELQTFIGSNESVVETIGNAVEEFILSRIAYHITLPIEENFSGPLSSIQLSNTYLASIERIAKNSVEIHPSYNLMTGTIEVSLENGDTLYVKYYPTEIFDIDIYASSKYFLLPRYPVYYINFVKEDSELIADYELLDYRILKIPNFKYGIKYQVQYRCGDKLPSDLKFAMLSLAKYWYRNYKDSSYGLKSYKIGDVSMTFQDIPDFLPLEIQKTIDKYSDKRISQYGNII